MNRGSILATIFLFLVPALVQAAGAAETVETEQELSGATTVVLTTGSVDVELLPTQGTPRFRTVLHPNRELIVSRTGARFEIAVEGRVSTTFGVLREEVTLFVDEGTVLEIRTGSGDIQGENLERFQFDIQTGSGGVDIRESSGLFELTTGSGNMRFVDVSGELRLTTASGDVSLRNVVGLRAFRSSSGDLSADDLQITGDLDLQTSSGDVRLELTNAASELQFALSTGSGDLRVDEIRSERSLQTGSGDFTIRADSGSGDMRFRTR